MERDLSLREEHVVWGKLMEKVLVDVLDIINRALEGLQTTLTSFIVYFQVIK